MRVVLLHFLSAENGKHSSILKKLSDAASKNGHQVDVVSGTRDTDSFRITPYEYVAVVCPCTGIIGGKISAKVSEVLENSGSVSGKKGCALVVKSGLSAQKTSRNLMRAMEKEGMVIDYFDVIENADHAAYVGKKIG
ncbi:hypothetical protein [Treponema brennaborense]|uniref:Flavodoxin-like domain-containing protein n=1 Tax=Treponema brennaborense (strain DSM 12168 / CIP 105900 / DD5/3) TaxID=906968 RepID=F4LQ38_TREBD|nr:hypothetical protein [Treponema brennaborense]AEE17116.1 hypothetical protein Trebr_1694 [Treponema brennaborense DSM 12168]